MCLTGASFSKFFNENKKYKNKLIFTLPISKAYNHPYFSKGKLLTNKYLAEAIKSKTQLGLFVPEGASIRRQFWVYIFTLLYSIKPDIYREMKEESRAARKLSHEDKSANIVINVASEWVKEIYSDKDI